MMAGTPATRAGRVLDGLALAALAFWVGHDALAKNLFGEVPFPRSIVDYAILYDASRRVIDTGTYPPGYPYPPSAVVLHYATARFPFPVSAALWLGVTMAATLTCWLTLARLLRLGRRPGALLLLLPAYASTASFLQWDLRSQNCNVVFLAALLLGVSCLRRDRAADAGFWLALGFSLKLFSVLCFPYLLWTGRRRELAWGLGFVAVFWLLLPAALLGADGTVRAYAGWFAQLREASDSSRLVGHPILISLHDSAAWLAGGDALRAGLVVNAVRVLWLVTFAGAWVLTRGREGGSYGLLADVSLLTLAPIALSPYLEPYHAVPFAVPALLLLHAAADVRRPGRQRLAALLLFAASFAVLAVPSPREVRGLVVNVKLLLAVGGVAVLARLRPRESQEGALLLPMPAAAWPERRVAA
jgi:hypothetical protein